MIETHELTTAIFAKTAQGQAEIQQRSLGLSPLLRRILVLVDGKRTGSELATFLGGQGDILDILSQLITKGCVDAQPAKAKAPAATASAPQAPETTSQTVASNLPGLPPAETRSAKDNDMARNFMINSVNSIIGQHARISLVKDIFHAADTVQLRTVYHAWAESMSSHSMGARRLPELTEKLFKVL